MASITELKGKIKGTIYSNGRGAINANDHQEMLLYMADIIESKQDEISDLDEIREGASKGATAVQYITEDDGNYLGEVNGIIAPNDEHYYLPGHGPAEDKVHTFAMVADVNNAIASAITNTLNTEV